MIDNLKLLSISLFILFVSTNAIPAQSLEKSIFREAAKTNFLQTGKENFAENSAFLQTRLSERNNLQNKPNPFDKLPKPNGINIRQTEKQNTDEPKNYEFQRGGKEINFEFGYSPFEPTHFAGPREYNTAGRKLGLAAFRFGRIIGTKKGITWEYLFEAIPFLFFLKNEVENPYYISPTETPQEYPTKRETSYGFGITPLAFRLYFLPKKRLKPFLQFGAGIIFTNKPMPLPDTTWYNFTGYWGGGFMFKTSPNRAITLSYRYFHISNFNVTSPNPGYNANVFALGYSFFYK